MIKYRTNWETQEIYFKSITIFPNLEWLRSPGLRLAIPSRGELVEGTRSFLTTQGVDTTQLFDDSRQLCGEFPSGITIFKLRAPDIIEALRRKTLDAAIIGTDVLFEASQSPNPPAVRMDRLLGFGGCVFCIGFPYASVPVGFKEIKQTLETKPIATSLPYTLKSLLEQVGIYVSPSQIIEMTGGVESAVKLFNVGAIADRVSSGGTMTANNIRPDLKLMQFRGAALVFAADFIEKGKGMKEGE